MPHPQLDANGRYTAERKRKPAREMPLTPAWIMTAGIRRRIAIREIGAGNGLSG